MNHQRAAAFPGDQLCQHGQRSPRTPEISMFTCSQEIRISEAPGPSRHDTPGLGAGHSGGLALPKQMFLMHRVFFSSLRRQKIKCW